MLIFAAMNFDFALLNIGLLAPQEGCDYPNVCSSFVRLFWVTEGYGSVVIDNETHTLSPDHLYLIPPLVTHHVHNEGPNRHYYIYFTDCSMQLYDHFQKYSYPFEIPATETDKQIIRHLAQLAPTLSLPDYNPQSYDRPSLLLLRVQEFQRRPVSERMEINGLLHILLSHFMAQASEHTSVSDRRIHKALWTVNHDLAAVPPLSQLAADACMNKNSFIRLFRLQTGYTPTDYIIRRRIMRAQVLFTTKKTTVKEVALQVGYDNISYFGRTFKRIAGISPMEFIRQNR